MAITEKNCFGIKHTTSTFIICIVGSIVIVICFAVLFSVPRFFQIVYCFGLSIDNVYLTVGILDVSLMLLMIFLIVGIVRQSPCSMMIWVIGNAIVWNVNLVLCLSAVILSITRKRKFENLTITVVRALSLLIFQVGWMVALCLVGRHWYVECEQIISQEYPARLPSMRQRFRTWSTWSRKGHHHKSGPSMISERTPQVLDKLMQSKS